VQPSESERAVSAEQTNLEHHNFGNDFCDGRVEEGAHGFAIDADWKDILPHCSQLFQLMNDLQSGKKQNQKNTSSA